MGQTRPDGVASFVRAFAGAVSPGFDNLFTPAGVKVQVLLNDGFAAICLADPRRGGYDVDSPLRLPNPRELMR